MQASDDRSIGRYELVKVLGKGSQGQVLLGRDPTLDRPVAIKLLSDSASHLNSQAEDGTPVEGRTASKLNHPNIVPVYDAGRSARGPYLVFEFVEGRPLSELLYSEGKMTLERAVPIMKAVLDAISHAHASEILHLDLSPRNILIDANGVPRVMDFGLAQYMNFTREPGRIATGTLRYMAPEHMLRRPLGPWTDVYALGTTFYELVTGVRPYEGLRTREIQLKIAESKPDLEPVRALPQGEALARFLAGAFERDREGRYSDAAAMREAFELFLGEAGLAGGDGADRAAHSTIDFLMRRMNRKKDFPSISRTLSDINRLTGEGSQASAEQLANVILRDLALTSKLLKLVNSAYYGTRAVEVTSISQAVVMLGVQQVRMTANSLTFFGALKGDSPDLKDGMTRSFLAGLVARHLGKQLKLPEAEEAFICGMCQNLGENLAVFYFAQDYSDIRELQREKGLDKNAASRGVLGVSYAELGAAVARLWNLPGAIVTAIRGMPPGPVTAPADDEARERDVAVFANRLCECLEQADAERVDEELDRLLERFAPSIELDRGYCERLLMAAFEKLKTYAPIFEISVEGSRYCRSVQAWLSLKGLDPETAKTAAAAG